MYARVFHLFCPLLMVSEEFCFPFFFLSLHIKSSGYWEQHGEGGGGNNISERLLGVIARSRFNLINALLSSDSHPSMPRQYL
jgi:hypothetical protein